MAAFKMYNCEFGIKIDGQNYKFNDVVELTIEDNVKNNITRGANGENKVGISFREGTRDPVMWTLPIIDMSAALKGVLDGAFNAQTRMDVYAIDRVTGSSKFAKNAILCNSPQQLQMNDQADSMNVSLEFKTFDSTETLKE